MNQTDQVNKADQIAKTYASVESRTNARGAARNGHPVTTDTNMRPNDAVVLYGTHDGVCVVLYVAFAGKVRS